MSFEDIINSKLKDWSKTEKGRKAIATAIKDSVGSGGKFTTDATMLKYAQYMKDLLRKEIEKIKRNPKYDLTGGEAYLDHVDIDSSVSWIVSGGKEYLYVGVSFDHSLMHRNSLFPTGYRDGIDIAYLVNNGYAASNYVYGWDGYGNHIRSALLREENNYIQRAVTQFNAEMSKKGVIAEYSVNYDGGTFGERKY